MLPEIEAVDVDAVGVATTGTVVVPAGTSTKLFTGADPFTVKVDKVTSFEIGRTFRVTV